MAIERLETLVKRNIRQMLENGAKLAPPDRAAAIKLGLDWLKLKRSRDEGSWMEDFSKQAQKDLDSADLGEDRIRAA